MCVGVDPHLGRGVAHATTSAPFMCPCRRMVMSAHDSSCPRRREIRGQDMPQRRRAWISAQSMHAGGLAICRAMAARWPWSIAPQMPSSSGCSMPHVPHAMRSGQRAQMDLALATRCTSSPGSTAVRQLPDPSVSGACHRSTVAPRHRAPGSLGSSPMSTRLECLATRGGWKVTRRPRRR